MQLYNPLSVPSIQPLNQPVHHFEYKQYMLIKSDSEPLSVLLQYPASHPVLLGTDMSFAAYDMAQSAYKATHPNIAPSQPYDHKNTMHMRYPLFLLPKIPRTYLPASPESETVLHQFPVYSSNSKVLPIPLLHIALIQ